jgi:serine/threonine-protein kinase
MEARHGRPEASRGHLAEVLARFPECQGARSLLAELELLNGDPARAAELYTALVSKDPALAELSNLGLAQLLLRRFDAARDTFARATRLEPRNPFVALNLADATALAQGHDAALPFYRRALELAGADPATSEPTPGWQLASVRAQALAHLGRGRDAVAQVQRVLAAAADAPQADFEAALVYAVAGERTSALVSADRALKGGVQPRWFELPAFDSLRTSAEFAALLKPPSPSARGLALNGG